MNFPRIEAELRHVPERVREAILGSELEPYFKQSGWLTPGGAAKAINWQVENDGSLIGKLGYFRAKNLSVFRFRVYLEPMGTGSRVVLTAQHGPYSPLLRFLTYAIGLCMCIVGVAFAFLADKIIGQGLLKVVEHLQRNIKMWDDASLQ